MRIENKQPKPWDRVELERFRFAVLQHVAGDLLEDAFTGAVNVDVTALARFHAEQFVLRFRAEVLGQGLETVTVRYPADWWQALRARWAPAWWLRRHPVRETMHTIEARAYYPNLNLPGGRVRLQQLEGPRVA